MAALAAADVGLEVVAEDGEATPFLDSGATAAPAAAPAAAASALLWTCNICRNENPTTSQCCDLCHAVRGAPAQREIPDFPKFDLLPVPGADAPPVPLPEAACMAYFDELHAAVSTALAQYEILRGERDAASDAYHNIVRVEDALSEKYGGGDHVRYSISHHLRANEVDTTRPDAALLQDKADAVAQLSQSLISVLSADGEEVAAREKGSAAPSAPASQQEHGGAASENRSPDAADPGSGSSTSASTASPSRETHLQTSGRVDPEVLMCYFASSNESLERQDVRDAFAALRREGGDVPQALKRAQDVVWRSLGVDPQYGFDQIQAAVAYLRDAEAREDRKQGERKRDGYFSSSDSDSDDGGGGGGGGGGGSAWAKTMSPSTRARFMEALQRAAEVEDECLRYALCGDQRAFEAEQARAQRLTEAARTELDLDMQRFLSQGGTAALEEFARETMEEFEVCVRGFEGLDEWGLLQRRQTLTDAQYKTLAKGGMLQSILDA